MILRFIIIATTTSLAAETLYKPEELQQHTEKENYFPLPSLNQSMYNIQAPTGPTYSRVTEARLATRSDHDE